MVTVELRRRQRRRRRLFVAVVETRRRRLAVSAALAFVGNILQPRKNERRHGLALRLDSLQTTTAAAEFSTMSSSTALESMGTLLVNSASGAILLRGV